MKQHNGSRQSPAQANGPQAFPIQRRGRPTLTDKTASGVRSVERALRILERLAESGAALSLTDISRITANSPGKTHRYLVSLARTGMVAQSQITGLYDLGPAARRVGLHAFNRFDPLLLAHERLARLRAETGHTLVLYVWTEAGPIIVRWEAGIHPLPLSLRVGSTLPLTRSATGRVFLAHLSAPVTGPVLKREQALEKADGMQPIGKIELSRALSDTRQRGFAVMSDGIFPGVDSISVPVFDFHGEIVCVITALGQRRHLREPVRRNLCERLCAAARSLSEDYGFTAPKASRAHIGAAVETLVGHSNHRQEVKRSCRRSEC
jgi:DNA-binding IclR family transcriptional regulator